MSLLPNEDILTKEIASWKGLQIDYQTKADEGRATFTKMLDDSCKYSKAINAKGRPFPTEPVIMALLLSQHKLIEWLEEQFKNKQNVRVNL